MMEHTLGRHHSPSHTARGPHPKVHLAKRQHVVFQKSDELSLDLLGGAQSRALVRYQQFSRIGRSERDLGICRKPALNDLGRLVHHFDSSWTATDTPHPVSKVIRG